MTMTDARIPQQEIVLAVAPHGEDLVRLGAEHGLVFQSGGLPTVIPGQGRRQARADGSVSTLLGGFLSGAFVFSVLDSVTMGAMFWLIDNTGCMDNVADRVDSQGAVFDFEYGPAGDAAGMPRFTGSAVCRSQYVRVGGVMAYSVRLRITGVVTEDSYS